MTKLEKIAAALKAFTLADDGPTMDEAAYWPAMARIALETFGTLGPVTADFSMDDGKGGRRVFQAPVNPPEDLDDYIDAILAEHP